MEKDAKIYIAGHRGLVGSAILKNLLAKGYSNIVLRTHKELDLTDAPAVAAFFNQEKPEYVFLAAAKVGGIVANNKYRGEFIYENMMIQNNVIHHSYVHGVKKLLFLGSTCIYPQDAPQPLKEEYLLTGTLEYTNEPYAIAKIAGIKMCENYNFQYDTNFISVMPTNLYGPNDNFNLETSHVLPALLRKIHLGKALEEGKWETIKKDLSNRPIEGVDGKASKEEILVVLAQYGITAHPVVAIAGGSFKEDEEMEVSVEIWGSGKPMREFLWSEDMADACVFLMENRDYKDVLGQVISDSDHADPVDEKNSAATHLNIGTGKEISIAHLAETIRSVIGFKGYFRFNTDKPDGTLRKLTDVSRLNQLGWKHDVDLQKGIEKIYTWYRNSED